MEKSIGSGAIPAMIVATRSIGYNHINVKYAENVGISVENVACSPDSAAGGEFSAWFDLLQSFSENDGGRGLPLAEVIDGMVSLTLTGKM